MLRALAILFSVALVVIAAGAVYLATGHAATAVRAFARDWGAPVSADTRPQVFTVRPGMSAREIGDDLERQKLIRSAFAFRLLVDQLGVGNTIPAGDYELSPSMSTEEIVDTLASGHVMRGPMITVVEGWRAEEIAQRLQALGLVDTGTFLQLVHQPDGVALPPDLDLGGEALNGYLFPATYEWDRHEGAAALLHEMLQVFDQRVDAGIRARLAKQGLSLRQGVILASIVERETARADERPVIASVYLNRLKAGMALQADPTVQYAIDASDPQRALARGFWRPLSVDDLKIDSPFNTYRTTGLPPEPICNPGLDSIEAVANPAETDYLYFVARGDGSHAFARTQEEHAENVRRYQPQ